MYVPFRIDVNVNVRYKAFMSDKITDWPLNKDGTAEWSIRDFAAFFDITPRAIRFYETKGLLAPKRRAGVRVFVPVDYMRLTKILRAKRLGFSLDDIKEVLDVTDGVVTDRSELLRRKANFETVIRNLKRRRKEIDVLTKDMSEICQIITESVAQMPDRNNIVDLAARYEAAFKNKMSFQGTSDDYTLMPTPS